MLEVILADSELELVPPDLWRHPAVRKDARRRGKRPGELLLDSSLHHAALRSLPDGERRGRPDIVHVALLVANESILNREGRLHMHLHTRHNQSMEVDPAMRVIKNYDRFKGLMEQLFERGAVPPSGLPLLRMQEKSLSEVVNARSSDVVVLLAERGERVPLETVLRESTTCIVGGFPHGDFLSEVKGLADRTVCLYPETLPAWTVLMEVVVAYEKMFIPGR